MVTPDTNGSERQQRDPDSTCWSIVLAAASEDSSVARNALAVLCETYWHPVYFFIRRRSGTVEDAQDLTQAFFARLIEKNYVAQAEPDRGKFRAYLLTAVKHFLANEQQKANALKRGGGRQFLSLDMGEAERRYAMAPATVVTPEALFDQQWAITLVNRVLDHLRREFVAADKELQFDVLKAHLSGQAEQPYAAVAESLGVSEGAARVAVHRMRARYRELLRHEIGQTVTAVNEVEGEIRSLFTSLGS